MPATRLFIVDDNAQMREAYALLLEDAPDLVLAGSAASCTDALASFDSARADVLVVDVSLPDGSGIELMQRLRERHVGLPTVVISGHHEPAYAEAARAAGAHAYLTKDRLVPDLLDAVREAAA